MNTQLKASAFSFVVHALIFASIIVIDRSIPVSKPLVIDFSLTSGQESKAGAYRDAPLQQRQPSIVRQKSEARNQKPELKETEQKLPPHSLNDASTASMPDDQPPGQPGIPQDTSDKEASVDSEKGKPGSSPESTKENTVTASGNDNSASAEGAKAVYLREHFTYIRDTIMKNLSYPQMARKMGWSGRVTISFVICENGDAEDIKIIESSGFGILDKSAVETVKKILPLPRPPLRAEIVIPVVYRLN